MEYPDVITAAPAATANRMDSGAGQPQPNDSQASTPPRRASAMAATKTNLKCNHRSPARPSATKFGRIFSS